MSGSGASGRGTFAIATVGASAILFGGLALFSAPERPGDERRRLAAKVEAAVGDAP